MKEKKRMTVKQLIEHLQTLDQDKGIWITYDFPFAIFPPVPDSVANEMYLKVYPNEGVEIGDYVISAG